jgi:hypothetical protein
MQYRQSSACDESFNELENCVNRIDEIRFSPSSVSATKVDANGLWQQTRRYPSRRASNIFLKPLQDESFVLRQPAEMDSMRVRRLR